MAISSLGISDEGTMGGTNCVRHKFTNAVGARSPVLLFKIIPTIHLGMFALVALMVGSIVSNEFPMKLSMELSTAADLADLPQVQLVATLTFLVGLIMVVMALLQMHVLASYLSEPLISGYTTASAIHVLISQFPPLLGLEGLKERSGFLKLPYVIFTSFWKNQNSF
jgi:MFS superfamily sulfate permease-like transporter